MTTTTIHDLNELGGAEVCWALDIHIPNTPTVRLVADRQNLTYNGNEYIAFAFTIGEISAGRGERPTWTLQIDNTTRAIEQYILEYDLYLKNNGIDGNIITATIYALNRNDLTQPIFEGEYELSSFNADTQWATFNFSAASPMNRQYPPRKLYQNFCGFKFGDARCKHTVLTGETCDKTFLSCKGYNNTMNFGGFVGMGRGLNI